MGLKVLHGQELHRVLFDFRRNINFLSRGIIAKIFNSPPLEMFFKFSAVNYLGNIFWLTSNLKLGMCILVI